MYGVLLRYASHTVAHDERELTLHFVRDCSIVFFLDK